MKIIIAGGGICGLTIALAAKTAGITPIIVQNRHKIVVQTFGGGIGLWPPSQMVYERLGILSKLQEVSGKMPKASYFNDKGQKLGQPSQHFIQRYRVLCIGRQKLSKILYEQCMQKGIEIRTGVSVTDAISTRSFVKAELSNGQNLSADLLIGADGINSSVRNIIMKDRKLPQIKPFHCGYAYFRAVVDLSKESNYRLQGSNWHDFAFESWGEEKRFGYIPLKAPETFWFVAVPIRQNGLKEYYGSHTCSQQQKKWILQLFQHWKAPISIKKLIQQTPAQTILRTDIRKIKGVMQFPWNSKDNKILILGDAANATAPNLAQGAGLAIESAWDLISMVNLKNGEGFQSFIQKRKKRAQTVQNLADLVAEVGQLNRPYSSFRNFFMSAATKHIKKIQQRIFQQVVRYSLGGSSNSPHWLASYNPHQGFIKTQSHSSSLLLNIIGRQQFKKLPEQTKRFRLQLIGQGQGKVTVQSGFLGKLLGLPGPMNEANFGAYVDTLYDSKTSQMIQKWTRVFGEGQNHAALYSTKHRGTPDFNSKSYSGLTLTESLSANIFMDFIRFGYDVKLVQNSITYKSVGLWFWSFKLPIPRFLLPTSSWIQEQTHQGWKFNGLISLPKIFGGFSFFKYRGSFTPKKNDQYQGKKVVIAGGTGFIGKQVARYFYKKGWHVTILSRQSKPINDLPFAKVQKWSLQNKSDFLKQAQNIAEVLRDKNIVINLAGENPSALRWTASKKAKILDSRLDSIKLLSQAIKLTKRSDLMLLQSSAGGIYGSRNDQVLDQDAPAGTSDSFRVNTIRAIEKTTKQTTSNFALLRIGHVLGQGGLLPFLKVSSFCRIKRFGYGGQYIPWIHVADVASAMFFIATNHHSFNGKVVNFSSPEHHTYDQLYKIMGEVYNRKPLIFLPEFMIKWSLGQLSSVILQSQRIQPKLLLQKGFKFQYSSLKQALASKQLL